MTAVSTPPGGPPAGAALPPAHRALSAPPRRGGDGAGRPTRTRAASLRRLQLFAEISLATLSVSAVLTLGRLFDDASFLPPLVLIALAGHLGTTVLRRRGASSHVVALAAAGGGALLFSWVLYPGTTFLGLPTSTTLRSAAGDLSDAWEQFGRVVAPAPVEPGFVLASAVAIWVVVWFSDWAAFRLAAVVEATLPASAVFIFGAMLGRSEHRTTSTMAFLVALLAFLLLHRMHRQARSASWVGEGAVSGGRSTLATGAGVVAVAVLIAGLVGPRLPGSDSRAVVDLRQSNGPGTRVTVSPLVDIRKRLVDQSEAVVFRVVSNQRAYWRLTALERFDGTVWSSSGSFAEAEGELPTSDPPGAVTSLTQDFRILDLAAIWLPAAFDPTSIQTDGTGVRWDEESSSLIVDTDSRSSDNITYRVKSRVPQISRAELERSRGEAPAAVDSRYTTLPVDFPTSVSALARSITDSGRSTYAKARLLQDYFQQQFEYDLDDTRSGHSGRAIESFIESRRGYCEQFAGTYAAMARSLGLPARVAVGFTPGDLDGISGNAYLVRGKHAHAWPEVFFDGVGWVPFEPTPGRGAPGAEDYTGLEEAQVGGVPGQGTPSTTTAPTAPVTTTPTASTIPSDRLEVGGGLDPTTGSSGGTSAPTRVGLALVVAVLAAVAWVAALAAARLLRRLRRRRGARTPADRVRVSWQESTESVASLVPAVRASETHDEFVGRTGDRLGEASVPMRRLADLASVAMWSNSGADGEAADEAGKLSAQVRHLVKGQIHPRRKLLAAVDPRTPVTR